MGRSAGDGILAAHVGHRVAVGLVALGLTAAPRAVACQPARPAAGPEPPLAVEARVDPVGLSMPAHVTVRLTRPAHVAVFEVRPGVGSVMRFPGSRVQATRLAAGLHRVPLEFGDGLRARGFPSRRGLFPSSRGGTLPTLRRTKLRPPELGRPYLLVVASRKPMWLSGHRFGRVFRPRDVRISLGLLIDAVLRDVLPHPELQAWAVDVRPAVAGPRHPRRNRRPRHRRFPRRRGRGR